MPRKFSINAEDVTAKETAAAHAKKGEELRDKLWEMALTVDFSSNSIAEIENHHDYSAWDSAMIAWTPPTKMVPGFSATSADIAKIKGEVEGSCLTDATKKSLLEALKTAK